MIQSLLVRKILRYLYSNLSRAIKVYDKTNVSVINQTITADNTLMNSAPTALVRRVRIICPLINYSMTFNLVPYIVGKEGLTLPWSGIENGTIYIL